MGRLVERRAWRQGAEEPALPGLSHRPLEGGDAEGGAGVSS